MCLRVRRGRPVSLSFLRRTPQASAAPAPGLHAYTRQPAPGERTRLHLRIEADGRGTLVVNANRIVHLNPTAASMAWLVPNRFRNLKLWCARGLRPRRPDPIGAKRSQSGLAHPDGACRSRLEPKSQPFRQIPSAPIGSTGLTYRCMQLRALLQRPARIPGARDGGVVTGLDRIRDIGVPHVCFTGGEATLRDDLPALVAHAQELGLVTGLLSNGRRLSDAQYVQTLASAGLDHVQITLESHDEGIHDRMVRARGAWRQTVAGLRNCAVRLYVMTNTTLLEENAGGMERTLDFLAELGVPTVGLNALIYAGRGQSVGTGLKETELAPLMTMARNKTEAAGQRLIWYTPTQYCHFDPIQMELGVKGCTCALQPVRRAGRRGHPCQSYYEPLGNILHDAWVDLDHDLKRSSARAPVHPGDVQRLQCSGRMRRRVPFDVGAPAAAPRGLRAARRLTVRC
jgi:hypothetical protein